MDERLAKDIQKFVDGPAHQRIQDARESLQIWLMAAAAIRDGSLDKAEQSIIAEAMGQELLRKMLDLFSGCGVLEVQQIVRDKLVDSIGFYQSVAPNDYSEERPKLEAQVARDFSQADFC
ncbi:MAG: hypothetical protein GY746_04080 [Gammaproteobacteria bacterium]|nr:hypothetical protein [Gammaproteobacteria bacterium]MCP4831964.1 hypothetical protein [Gammaproteobacteria bacterium]MCP4927564.1 hypothetical protein [Gammaproteobacteria bacterium]